MRLGVEIGLRDTPTRISFSYFLVSTINARAALPICVMYICSMHRCKTHANTSVRDNDKTTIATEGFRI